MNEDKGTMNDQSNQDNQANHNNAIVQINNNGNSIIPPASNDNNTNTSTTYSGYGATPNVKGIINSKQGTQQLNINNDNKIDFAKELGPVILNNDGTISRIKNWLQLTPNEQEKVRKRIMKRNAKRRLLLQQKQNKNDDV